MTGGLNKGWMMRTDNALDDVTSECGSVFAGSRGSDECANRCNGQALAGNEIQTLSWKYALAKVERSKTLCTTTTDGTCRLFKVTEGAVLHLKGLHLIGGRVSTATCSAPEDCQGGLIFVHGQNSLLYAQGITFGALVGQSGDYGVHDWVWGKTGQSCSSRCQELNQFSRCDVDAIHAANKQGASTFFQAVTVTPTSEVMNCANYINGNAISHPSLVDGSSYDNACCTNGETGQISRIGSDVCGSSPVITSYNVHRLCPCTTTTTSTATAWRGGGLAIWNNAHAVLRCVLF